MGRYYNGDIEGKFMFGVQGSDAGERFGAFEQESGYINYCVNRESYSDIVVELETIRSKGHVERVEKMFEKESGWNDTIMKKYGVSDIDMSEYADYKMGKQIKDWFDKNENLDELYFEAEL